MKFIKIDGGEKKKIGRLRNWKMKKVIERIRRKVLMEKKIEIEGYLKKMSKYNVVERKRWWLVWDIN